LRELGFPHIHAQGMKGCTARRFCQVPFTPGDARQWCDKDDCRHSIAVLADGTEILNFYVPPAAYFPMRRSA
jgi:exodeoxyribonuclease-3